MLVSLAAVGPGVWTHNAEVVREHTLTLMLVGVAACLGLVERNYQRADKALHGKTSLIADNAIAPHDAQRFSPLR